MIIECVNVVTHILSISILRLRSLGAVSSLTIAVVRNLKKTQEAVALPATAEIQSTTIKHTLKMR